MDAINDFKLMVSGEYDESNKSIQDSLGKYVIQDYEEQENTEKQVEEQENGPEHI